MRNLKDILLESKKTYEFKIGVAGELPEGCEDRLKLALEKYKVLSFSKGKTTPIQERPLDFPNLSNTEVTFFEVTVQYPTVDSILQEYLGSICNIPRSHIIVRNPNSPLEMSKEETENTVYDVLLTNPELGGQSAQQSVGNNRVMDLLKELEAAKKEREGDNGFKVESAKAEPQNNKSVVGK